MTTRRAHNYGGTLDRFESIALRKRYRTEMTKGIWYTGPTGSGNSHAVFNNTHGEFGSYHPETHYGTFKNVNDEWWDGYNGQPIVILNEFRGQVAFGELLDLTDKWPKSVKWRYRESVPFLAKYVLDASIKSPEDVFRRQTDDEQWVQFHRRFEVKLD